jgi:Zn-dependent protease with chaperone function
MPMSAPEFDALMFDATHSGAQRVRLRLTGDALLAITPDEQAVSIPYSECRIELGGANGEMWFCRTASLPDLTLMCGDPSFASVLHERGGRELAACIDRLAQRARAGRRRSAILLGITFTGLLIAAIGAYAGIRVAGKASVRALPTSIDATLGKQAFASMKLEGPVSNDTPAVAAVRTIVARLAPHAEPGFEFEVKVVDAPIVNAFALPGGTVVVYTGLLAAAESPEQVAGVIAHEMAHVTRRHGMQRIAQSIGVIGALQLLMGDVSGLAGLAVHVLREGTVNGYSREQETEADLVGVQTMVRARLPARSLAGFLAVLKRQEQNSARLPSWLATHPDLAGRIGAIEAESARLPSGEHDPFALRWIDVKPKTSVD